MYKWNYSLWIFVIYLGVFCSVFAIFIVAIYSYNLFTFITVYDFILRTCHNLFTIFQSMDIWIVPVLMKFCYECSYTGTFPHISLAIYD